MKFNYLNAILFFSFFQAIIPSSIYAQCAAGQTYNTYCYDDGEVNVVAFEFCPTAGDVARSEIIAGSFSTTFPAAIEGLTVYEGASGSGTGGTIVLGPVDGDLTGTVITASAPDLCLIFVINSNTFFIPTSCQDGFETALEVCSESIPSTTVTFTAPADLCENAGVQTGLSGGMPSGGVYSGPGVTDDGNGMTYSFDPVAAGVGIHTLTYTNGGAATDDVEVFALGGVSFTAPPNLCIDAGIQTGLGGGLPAGGIYSGPGVTDNGNGLTYSFNPGIAGLGVHSITYTESGDCNESATDNIEVLAACGCPPGQDSYFHCSDGSESDLVIFEVCPSAGEFAQANIDQGTYSSPGNNLTVYQGTSGSGTGGTIVYGPQTGNLAGAIITANVADECLIFVSNTSIIGGCQDGLETALEVCGESLVVSFIAPDDLCVDDGVQTGLSGGLPTGGVYSGPGVTDDGNGMTYSFDPAAAGAGVQTLAYTASGNTVMDDVEVFAIPTVTFTAPADLCLDAGVQTGLGGGLPVGGIYSGPGVTDDGNGLTYSFDPFTAGLGIHIITYTEGSPCAESANDNVEVLAACACPVGQDSYIYCSGANETNLVIFEVCPNAGEYSQATISQGTYNVPGNNLTIYQGATGSGTGGTIVYGPQTGDLAGGVATSSTADDCLIFVSNTIIGGCQEGFETLLQVCGESSTVFFTALDDLCEDAGIQTAGGGIPTGGVYSGPGVTDAGNGLVYFFDPAVAGVGTHTLSYTVGGNTATDDVEVCPATPVTFTALNDLSVNAGIQTGVSGGLPTGGVYSGPGVTDDGNGLTYTFDPAAAGVGVHILTYTFMGTSATDDVEVLNLIPPTFSKSFDFTEIGPGSVTTLTFTIDNTASGTGVTNLDFTDNLPAGMTIATPANVSNSCGLGTVTAPDGGTTIAYTGGTLGAGNSCTITVDVTSSTPGTHVNTTGDLTSSSGNSGTATANLTVSTDRPGFSKSFSPDSINLGERSTLTFTIDNTANTGDMLSLNFTDNLPTGMEIASPPNISISCTGGTLTATPGGSVITYDYPFTFPALAAGTSCTISVDVIGTTLGPLNNVTGNLSGFNSMFQTVNSGKASAALEVLTPPEILIQKSFNPNPATPGGTTNLEFTITNFSRDFEATNISFTDDLTTVLSGLSATGTPLNDICGTGSQLSGTTMLTFSGGTLPPESSCTFSVPLSVPAGAAIGTYPNITGAITADFNGSTVTGNIATANLFIQNVPTFTKTFLDNPIPAGGTTTLEFTISNNSTTSALTDITFTDIIDDFINGSIVSGLPAAGSCGAGSLFFTTTTGGLVAFQMTGGNIAAGDFCTFTIDLTIPANTGAGTYTNTTGSLQGTVDGVSVSGLPATDDLEVLGIPSLAKSFTDDPVDAGGIVNLEFTITHDEFATGDATGISFTDDLNAVIPGLAAIGLPLNDICGTGSSISGTTNLSFTGGTLSPGQTCTFSVPVQVPAGVVTGSYTNTTGSLTATVGGQSATGSTASDDLDIGGFTFTKEFLDNPVIPGELTTLRFTFDNTSTFDATSIVFTDDLNSVTPGLTTEGTLPTGAAACNAALVTGTSFFIYSGGSVPAGTSCSFDIPVRIPASATPGTYTNVTSNMTTLIDGATRVIDPANAPLVVEDNFILLTKEFIDDPVTPGGTVTVEYTLTNLNTNDAISNIAFTNDFDSALSGLVATGLPVSACGGTASGTSLLSFTGGSLAAGASCTFSVTLQTPAGTPYGTIVNCTTSGVTGEILGLPVVGDPASDDLLFQSLEFSKSFAGSVAAGESTTLTFTITNSDPVNTITDIAFTDDLDAFISGAVATNLPLSGFCGPLSGATGTSFINFARGELAPGQSCSFDVTVDIPCGTAAGSYLNTTSLITATGNAGLVEGEAATDNLTVLAVPIASFTAPADLCIDAGVQAGLGGGTPTGGTYSGTGVTDDGNGMTYSFDPATAGIGVHTLTYTFTDGNSCTTSASDDIEVFAVPVAAFTALADLCIDAGVQAGLGGGLPSGAGGVYSGTGVTDDGNGMTYSFDPATAGAGIHTLTYSFTDINGCADSASDDVEVFALPTVNFTAPADLCIDAGVQTGLGGGTPTGGLYSGSGVIDDGNGMTYSFDPAAAGAAVHTLTYDFTDTNGCSSADSDDVEVFALPTVTLAIPAGEDEYCANDPVALIVLAGSPTGGVYSGTGVTNIGDGLTFTFNPGTAGAGTHIVTYTFTDANGCSDSATDNIEVFALPIVTFTALADLCLNDGVQTGLGSGSPAGGVYSGTGVTDDGNGMTYSFDPVAAGVGTHTLTYTFTDINGCTISASDDVEVFANPTAAFTAPADLCIDAGVQAGLGGGTPTGGVYSGPGVTDDGNGMTYSFDPAAAGVGTHSLTYDFTDTNGCTDSASDDVEVFALPIVTFNIPAAQDTFCIDAGLQTITGGSPTGGVYSGPGVTDDANGTSFTFDPAAAGLGLHILTYTFTDGNGCTGSDTDFIRVEPLPTVNFIAPADLCVDAGVQAGLGGGTPPQGTENNDMGVYSGPGVTDDGNGMTYSFDPAAAGVGMHTLTYTYTNFAGCTNSAEDDVEVFGLPDMAFTAPAPTVCVQDPPVTGLGGGMPSGGTYSGLGVIDDGNGMTFTFDPMASAPAGGNIPVIYTFTDGNGCTDSATDDIFVNPICCEFTAICPTTTDLGGFDCTQLGNIPAHPTTEVVAEAAPYNIVIGNDPCGTIVVLSVDDITNYDVCTVGGQTITRTVTVFDDLNANGVLDIGEEFQDCVYTFDIVEDTTDPTIVCPGPVTVECIEDVPAPDVTLPVVADICDPAPVVTHEGDVSDGQTCPETITRTYRVTDACGNFAECTQIITVDDITDPTITCPAPVTVACLQDVPPADITLPMTSDNCLAPIIVTHEGDDVNATQCDGGTITRTYSATDACGNFVECTQLITVSIPPPPVIVCPADQTVACIDDFVLDPNTATATSLCGDIVNIYIKNPLISGVPNCDGTVYTYIYVAVDDCGRSSECEQQVLIQNDPATITVPVGGTVSCFEDIDITVDDATVNGACANYNLYLVPPVLNGVLDCPGTTYTFIYRLIDVCGNTVEEPVVFTTGNNDAPTIVAPVDLTIDCLAAVNTNPDNTIVTTSCGNNIDYNVAVSGPIVNGPQDCPGTTLLYTYIVTDACGRTASDTQTFTIDNDGPVIDCPGVLNIISCEDGDYNAIIDAWIASVTATSYCGGSLTMTNDFDEVNGLCISNGVTNVTFIATDACGTTNTCIGTIIITDTEAPEFIEQPTELLVPCNGVTQDIFDDWIDTHGGAAALDGCWGDDILWSTIPANPTLNCAGGPEAIIVEFVATDGCGNSSSVTGIFNTKLQPDMVNISGQVFREDGEAVEGVQIGIEGGNPGIPDMDYTSNTGGYGLPEIEYEDNLYVQPEKNDDITNGMSTFDLILMYKHILNIEMLDSPYKIIAADVNRSGHISTIDLVLLRRVILLIDTEFQFNTSWRFVEANFVFPNPANPFSTPFPEVYMLTGAEEEEADFVGVKIGDLNLSAITHSLMADPEDRSDLDDLIFEVEDQDLNPEQQYRIDFTARNFEQINGFQFTINFDPSALEVMEMQGADLIGFDDNNYGLSKLDQGAVTVSWNDNSFLDLKPEEVVFSLVVNAKSDVQLSDVLSITSAFTRAEAYRAEELMNVNLVFNNGGTIVQQEKFRLFQNRPNPFKDETLISFSLPEAAFATLTIYDINGRVLKVVEDIYQAGYNEVAISRSDLGAAGSMYYQLMTENGTLTKTMLVIE